MPVSLLALEEASSHNLEHQAEQFRKETLVHLHPHPFSALDTTVGVENEFQAAVIGQKEQVDLPLIIEQSNYFQNLVKRAARGDMSLATISDLRHFLNENDGQIWENSWVRFPRHLLSRHAETTLQHDLLADKSCAAGAKRTDCHRFLFRQEGEEWLRIPVSYLLKLALADAITNGEGWPEATGSTTGGSSRPELNFPLFLQIGKRLMAHLISDNTSPEITSFLVTGSQNGELPGREAARETARRFFVIQLLVQYANQQFALQKNGQTCHLYLAPNPPLRQKRLNDLVSDAFYRELFLNPCLSGWEQGEEKNRYMALCHRTLSRSQLNTIAKLKEAGIVTNNLVVLPNTSNTCLANNGTHITLGSKVLSRCYGDQSGPSGTLHEKYFGDLVIKIVEHFLPLFVTTVSAAPYRLGFSDFHPEKALGFLPHELDYTHLRMLWRRWKKKAEVRFCGHSFTPMGPEKVDRFISRVLRLRGDYIPDVRLIDYLVALQSVEQSPALDGRVGNQERLKKDLTDMGVFDTSMAMYLPYRLREQAKMHFSGFEGRHYSLFPRLLGDMTLAVNLQTIVTAMAYHWVATGAVRHHHIPDDPFIESERRQIFFATSIGLPTFFVHADSKNHLLRRILSRVQGQRHSRRYKGYIRVGIADYQQACLQTISEEGGWLLEASGVKEELASMKAILVGNSKTAAGRMTKNILKSNGLRGWAMDVDAGKFNQAAEQYYRTTLWSDHMEEGLRVLSKDGRLFDREGSQVSGKMGQIVTGGCSVSEYIDRFGSRVITGKATAGEIQRLILLSLLIIEEKQRQQEKVS
jgi:hypothetical protein